MITTRVFAAEPTSDTTVVEVFERANGATRYVRWEVAADGDEIAALATAIANAPLGALAALAGAKVDSIAPTFLICTQGSHDSCCGTSGVALAHEVEASRPDYVVRRVSHTGGHRFSPTFLSFPEGRMWAYADLALVDRIANDCATGTDHSDHGRGWWGAKVGPAQVAEVAVRAECAEAPFRGAVVEPVADAADGSKAFAVTTGHGRWHVDVRVGRELPTIACESPGGLPVKPGREFIWSIERQ